MTNLPDDMIDPAEGRLARRVGTYTDQAVFPIDPVAIAASAAIAARRQTLAGRLFGGSGAAARLVLVGAVALIGAVALGTVLGGGAHSVPPAQTAATNGAQGVCASTDLSGRIVGWDGAAGNRIATVELTNTTATDCRLTQYQLSLVDGGGRGQGLILSQELQPGVFVASGATVHTLVDVSNYCLAFVPVEPVSIRLDDPLEHGDVVLTPAAGGISGVPPCSGAPGSAGSISQQAWVPGPAPAE
jgi:hypothetical protein